MIKKFAFISAALLCALSSQAIVWQYDNFDKQKKTCRFSGWSGSQPSSGKLSIKETYEKDGVTYKVTTVKTGALNGLDKVTELTISANVNYIEPRAGFHTMTNLATIKVNQNNTAYFVEDGVLCAYTRAICLPQKSTVSSVSLELTKNIDPYAFFNCTNLKSIDLEYAGAVDFTIGSYAFYNTGLTSVKLPKYYVPGDEEGIFEKCKQLQKIRCEVNDMVVCKAFARGCSNLTEINFYPAPKEIRQAAFKNCRSLNNFKFNAEVIMKEDSIFYNTGFTKVNFEGEASYRYRPLGAAMFSACSELESINFSLVVTDDFVKCLKLTSCFADNCPKLKTVIFPEYVEATSPEVAGRTTYTFGRNTPISKLVISNLKIKNNYLVNYNVVKRYPDVYLTEEERDFDFAPNDFCDMKWLFIASDGAEIDASIYCAGIAPMMTGVCPYATYYIPWGHPGNYADAVEAGNNVYEMFTWDIKEVNNETELTYKPVFSWVSCPEVVFNDTHRKFTANNIATIDWSLDDIDFVRIVSRVNGVDLETKYTKAMFPNGSSVDNLETVTPTGMVQVYNLNGVKVIDVEASELDNSPLPKGIYIVKSGDATRKIVR